MIYQYKCTGCACRFDVYKSVKDMERNETCTQCGEFGIREFVPHKVHFTGTKVEHAEYNPGLGCVVKNKKHKEELCKMKGVVEIGNDYKSPDAMHDKYAKDRTEKLEQAYDKADSGWVGDGTE